MARLENFGYLLIVDRIAEKKVVPALRTVLKTTTEHRLKVAAIQALGSLELRRYASVGEADLLEIIKDYEVFVRASAELSGRFRPAELLPEYAERKELYDAADFALKAISPEYFLDS